MISADQSKLVKGLMMALRKERPQQAHLPRTCQNKSNETSRNALLGLAETEHQHGDRWAERLVELGIDLPLDRDNLFDKMWRWILVQSGTENALKYVIESNEEDDTQMYEILSQIAPTRGAATQFNPSNMMKPFIVGHAEIRVNNSEQPDWPPGNVGYNSSIAKAGIGLEVDGSVRLSTVPTMV